MNGGMHFLKPGEYQPQMTKVFEDLKSRVLSVLPFTEIEHIGSSSIKNAVSKGDLDVLVRTSKDRFTEVIKALESLGFSIKQGTLRTDSLCMLEGPQNVAIQLIEKGSEFEMFVRFRDRMNANPNLVEQYNLLKLNSAGLTENEYRARKKDFIEAVLSE